MSMERWDVVLRFIDGPLSFEGDQVRRGPVIRMGANPGPGGLKLEGYRALDDRQAVIQSYDGGTVSIAPVGTNQVRVAPYENVDWNEIAPIRNPVYLDPGSAIHLGPPGRGVTFLFVESRRLGVWEQERIKSAPDPEGEQVGRIRTDQGRPPWFIPSMVMIGVATVVFVYIKFIQPPEIPDIGPVDAGEEYYDFVSIEKPVDPELKKGFNEPFHDFVMKLNADAASWTELTQPPQWDQKFLEYVTRSAQYHGRAWKFWQRLEQVRENYGYVVTQLRDNGLPEIFAAIPYQESQYYREAQSYVCARSYWQFMPEVARRAGMQVSGCKLRGSDELWAPVDVIPPLPAKRIYVDSSLVPNKNACRIQSCQVDQREDLQAATRGAIKLLAEAYNDEELRNSGSVVQATILSHNMGYDDGRFNPNRIGGVLPAWRRYASAKKVEKDQNFYGANILCTQPNLPPNEKCGSVLWKETQHYAYNIVAQHILAVCYYAKNHGEEAAFDPWRQYDRGEGYCANGPIKAPTSQEVLAKGGAR